MGFFSRCCADIGFRRGGCSVRLGDRTYRMNGREIITEFP